MWVGTRTGDITQLEYTTTKRQLAIPVRHSAVPGKQGEGDFRTCSLMTWHGSSVIGPGSGAHDVFTKLETGKASQARTTLESLSVNQFCKFFGDSACHDGHMDGSGK